VRAIGDADARVRCIRRVHRRGRASACIEGLLAAQGRFVAVMDADLQHDEGILPEMVQSLRSGAADIVIGTRYLHGGSTEGLAGMRQWISRAAGSVARALLGINVSDPTSGFFATRREIVDRLAPELAVDGFNTLLDIVSTKRMALEIAELPYRFRARQHGESKLGARIGLDFAALILSRATSNALPQRFLLFCLVGISGVFVHLGVLFTLKMADFAFPFAQAVAALAGIASNFCFNNIFTYRDQRLEGLAALKGLGLYAIICACGYISNIGVANWIFAGNSTWWLAGAVGAVVGAVWNYSVSATLVWRRPF
jgi:dolichol-phosphate mannosyltransferase